MAGKSETKKWIVTSTGERPLAELRKELGRAGFTIDQVFEEIGIIAGRAGERSMKDIRAIRGIADVSREASIDIGPPDAPIV